MNLFPKNKKHCQHATTNEICSFISLLCPPNSHLPLWSWSPPWPWTAESPCLKESGVQAGGQLPFLVSGSSKVLWIWVNLDPGLYVTFYGFKLHTSVQANYSDSLLLVQTPPIWPSPPAYSSSFLWAACLDPPLMH